MFDRIFGNYLLKMGKLSKKQLENIFKKQDSNRVRLGLIAMSEKLMTIKQADEVNKLQASMDKRFGDIAIERGYLTEEQVKHLLSLQGNIFLTFIQTVLDTGCLEMQQINEALEEYQKEKGLTLSGMEDLKSGEINRMVSVLMCGEEPIVQELVGIMLRTATRLVDNHMYVEEILKMDTYQAAQLSYQMQEGEHTILSALSGSGEAMMKTAIGYIGKKFIDDNEDALDSLCELVNCVDGLLASDLSTKGIFLDMLSPEYTSKGATINGKNLFVIRMNILEEKIDYIVSYDAEFMLN
ncbi:MAG: hypothetical protein RR056_05210 [Acetivibrio sp.]